MRRGSRFEEEEEEEHEAVMQDNRFDNKGGGDQNIDQGKEGRKIGIKLW